MTNVTVIAGRSDAEAYLEEVGAGEPPWRPGERRTPDTALDELQLDLSYAALNVYP
jgi:hypothetical protein